MLSRRATLGLFVPVLLILVGYVLYPSLRTFAAGLAPEHVADVFSSWRSANVRALVNSLWISVLSVLGAGVLGTALAYAFFRYRFPLRRVLMGLAVIPLALPPLVGVLAFLFLYGESGILPRGLQRLFGLEDVPFAFDGLKRRLACPRLLALCLLLPVRGGGAARDRPEPAGSLIAGLGASGWTTFRRVILPLIRPALVSASLLVFMISMASFTAPLLFAGTEPFLTTQIYTYKTNGNLDLSATVSTVLTLICLVFLIGLEAGGRRQVASAGKGTSAPPRPLRSGWGQAVALVLALGGLLFLFLPCRYGGLDFVCRGRQLDLPDPAAALHVCQLRPALSGPGRPRSHPQQPPHGRACHRCQRRFRGGGGARHREKFAAWARGRAPPSRAALCDPRHRHRRQPDCRL